MDYNGADSGRQTDWSPGHSRCEIWNPAKPEFTPQLLQKTESPVVWILWLLFRYRLWAVLFTTFLLALSLERGCCIMPVSVFFFMLLAEEAHFSCSK